LKFYRSFKLLIPYFFSKYYSIKKDSIEFNIDKESKETKSDLIYLKMANTWGSSSHCKRMKVGCLVVKDKSIILDAQLIKVLFFSEVVLCFFDTNKMTIRINKRP
jgi:hypothetical protein